MIISVASGKGGAGKTATAANLAVALDGPVLERDCDVEELLAKLNQGMPLCGCPIN